MPVSVTVNIANLKKMSLRNADEVVASQILWGLAFCSGFSKTLIKILYLHAKATALASRAAGNIFLNTYMARIEGSWCLDTTLLLVFILRVRCQQIYRELGP